MASHTELLGPSTPFVTIAELAAQPCADGLDPDVEADAAVLTDAVTTATQILYTLSAQTLTGEVTETVRPHLPGACNRVETVPLIWPVVSIGSVKVNGAVVTDWFLLDDGLLRRAPNPPDGCGWPAQQRLDLPDTEDDTFSVTYTHGIPIPEWAKDACMELACALLEGTLTGRCSRLPEGMTTLSRQGVSYSASAQADALRDGMTPETLPAVVRFVALSGTASAKVPTGIYSPDLPRLRHVTYPA